MSVLSHGTRSKVGTSNAMSVKSTFTIPSAGGQEVSILPRPLTAAGGISIASRKSNAVLPFNDQKLNNSQYFAAFISKKEKDIANEIERLKNETETIEANILDHSKRQKTYNTLLSDVENMQQTIADYNLALENEANGCDPEEIEDLAMRLKDRNQELANEIDNVFVRVKRLEEEGRKIEEEKATISRKIQLILDSSDRKSNIKYLQLKGQLEEAHKFKHFINSEIKALEENLKEIQSVLEQRSDKELMDRIDEVEETIASLMQNLETITEKLFIAQMSTEEAKAHLLEKVKRNKANELKIDDECAKIQDKLQGLVAKENELFRIICNAEPPEISSCRTIWEQRKMAIDFLAESNDTVSSLQAENQTMTKNIATLQGILKEKMSHHVDSKISAKNLHDKINYKSKNLNNSKWTISQLLDQRKIRTDELEKVRNIKGKIQKECEQLEVEISKMKQMMEQYEDLKTVELESEAIKTYLIQMKEKFIEHKGAFSSHIKQISDEYNRNNEYLNNSTIWKSMEKYEDMIARQSQVNFELKQELDLKRRLTDYESVKHKCFNLMNELNKLRIPERARDM